LKGLISAIKNELMAISNTENGAKYNIVHLENLLSTKREGNIFQTFFSQLYT